MTQSTTTPLLHPQSLHSRASFLAGDTPVTIIPSFTYPQTLGLISRKVGPFTAGIETPSTPLWLACTLRRKNLARIVPPSWLRPSHLRNVLRHERDPNESSFSPFLPHRHAEIARSIMAACCGRRGSDVEECEVEDAEEIMILLEDIATVRMDKIRRNVHTLSLQSLGEGGGVLPIIDVTGIGSLEVLVLRPFIATAFRDHYEMLGNKG
eukprot:CAMPEP_0172499462 /NCGR_PEP_ID=MMETSP1066-20121228/127522_1 /TAXON_ID=671091 /ORGANISM="Coscinodiscus wailesii, Strain CCMP2513" /LENGTH=208 /DNA_ID=CAMNT_0013273223 /DNA_START=179 /DNA_END=802 /DNA_ORIENTATION=-